MSQQQGPTVLITGATGFIGSALTHHLVATGHRVIVFTRDPLKARRVFGQAVSVVDTLTDIAPDTPLRAVVHLAGAPVMGRRWTTKRRQLLMASRTEVAQDLLGLIDRLCRRPDVLVAASAVGFYGVPMDGQLVDETSPAQPGRFQSDLCAAMEDKACAAEAQGVRVVRLRFGIVLGRGGGAYPGLSFAARMGMASRLGSARQPVPWLHLDDAVGLIRFAMDDPRVTGAVNAVAPDTHTQESFARAMAEVVQRRVRVAVPHWMLRLLLGEMSELLLCGQWVIPKVATGMGYRYRFATLRAALEDLAHDKRTSC